MKIAKYNYKLPRLTKEEFELFKWKDATLWKKYNVNWTIQRKTASALQELAVKKLLGGGGFKKNKKEAIHHHLKACVCDSGIISGNPSFRKAAGLLVKNKIDFWAEDVANGRDDIFLKIQSRIKDLETYIFIKKEYEKGNIQNNLQFQKEYKKFYVMNMAGLTDEFFKEYFRILSYKKTNLRKILNRLYEIPRRNGTNSVQFSFATKLLHTVNNVLPIYDSLVGKSLELKIAGNNKKDRINSCVKVYSRLKRYYKKFLDDTLILAIILLFRKKFKCDKRKMSDTKILDFLIWTNAQLKDKRNN